MSVLNALGHGADVPYCSAPGKIFTVCVHLGVTAVLLALIISCDQAIGVMSMQITAAHCAVLLGVAGPKAGTFTHWWVPSPIHEIIGASALFTIGLVQYILVGVYTFEALESGFFNPEGAFADSTFIDKLWFCFVLMTTVGYGNTFVPTIPTSRFFTLLWSLYGLFIFSAGSSIIQTGITHIVERVANAYRRMRPAAHPRIEVGEPFTPSDLYFVGKDLFTNYVCFILLNVIGSLLFWLLEGQGADGGMTILDAFYHCIMTATTIGLGDIAPQTQGGRLYGIVHMVLSVALFGSMLGTILSALDRRSHALKKTDMLRKELDADLIAQLDRDGDGVDQSEFVLGMLETLGVISKEDYEPFIKQFKEMDKSNDGRLTKEDLVLVAKSKREKAAAEAEAKKSSAPTYESRLESHARDLLLPAFLGAFAFMDISTYGVILTVSGVLNSVAIGIILGYPPSEEKYKTVFSLTLWGAASAQVVAIGWLCVLLISPEAYLVLDPVQKLLWGATLNDNGYISSLNETEIEMMLDTFSGGGYAPQSLVMFVLYITCFIFGIGLDLMTAMCSYLAYKELRAKNTKSTTYQSTASSQPE